MKKRINLLKTKLRNWITYTLKQLARKSFKLNDNELDKELVKKRFIPNILLIEKKR